MSGQVSFVAGLGAAYPDCIEKLSSEMRFGLEAARERYNLDRAASIESWRQDLNEAMADLFESVDFVMASSNPDVGFKAEGPPPSTIPGADLIEELGFARAIMNNAALTAPSNMNGSPAVSIPAGTVDGLPVGLQVLAEHHREQLLLDLALIAEREHPWPLVAPGSPL
jgi:Asp-tRNA(Asn)/Glu-tRNA(Gln) amidotransferase A subunit family amidase